MTSVNAPMKSFVPPPLNPKPQTLNPKPQTLNPKPQTLNPKQLLSRIRASVRFGEPSFR